MIEHTEGLPVGASLQRARVFDTLPFGSDGLLPAVAQPYHIGEVLMLASMNRAALTETLRTGQVCYWSRAKACPWRKGGTSGHIQALKELRLHGDGDALLMTEQTGPACHTGRTHCFTKAVRGNRLEVNSQSIQGDWV